jgi:lipopolysaccharide biosynthesis regulator YciM
MRAFIFLFLVIFLLVISFVGYLAYLNPGDVNFYLKPGTSIQIPMTALVLLSMSFGGFMVILAAGYIETRRWMTSWGVSRQKKRDHRIAELLHKGLGTRASGRNEDAIGLFQKVLQIDAHHVPAMIALGDLYRSQGNLQEALRLHQAAQNVEPNNIEVLLSLAEDFSASKRTEEAVLVLENVLKIDSEGVTAYVRLRDIYVESGQWTKAHEVQERIVKADHSREEQETHQMWLLGIKYELGRKMVDKGRYDHARQHFRACVKLNKDYIPAHVGLGEALLAEGKKDEAAKLWGDSYRVTGNMILLHHLEELYLSTGQPSRILNFYHTAVQRDPGNIVLQFYLGKLYYRLEMVDEAMDILASIDMGGSQISDIHKLMGNLFLQKGDLAASVEEFKRALNFKKRLLIPYFCPVCDYHTSQWSGRCPRCQKWNTFVASPIIKKGIPARSIIQARP